MSGGDRYSGNVERKVGVHGSPVVVSKAPALTPSELIELLRVLWFPFGLTVANHELTGRCGGRAFLEEQYPCAHPIGGRRVDLDVSAFFRFRSFSGFVDLLLVTGASCDQKDTQRGHSS